MEITMSFAHISLLLLAVLCSTNAYSKYGRTCKDIGCLPSEVCMIAQDSCSYNQQDGKECGTYPTCRKSNAVSNSPGLSVGVGHPNADNRYNPNANTFNNNPNINNNYNNPYFNPPNVHNTPGVDRNQIFGNPNTNIGNPNQPWNHLPIFPPSPTSGGGGGGIVGGSMVGGGNSIRHGSQPQQPIYPQGPAYPPPPNPVPFPNGMAPQFPFAFGFPPPGSQQYNIHQMHPNPTTRSPGLLDQFFYNKRRGNGSASLHGTWKTLSSIFILSICNVLAASLLINHNYH